MKNILSKYTGYSELNFTNQAFYFSITDHTIANNITLN